MTTVRYMLSTEIDQAKCGACTRLVRPMGHYCSETRQRLDLLDREYFGLVLRHCGGPYPYPKNSSENVQPDLSRA